MKLIQTLLQQQIDTTNQAAAFVDYEHWYYSYKHLYGLRPHISAWRKELEDHFLLTDIQVFGDFSHPPLIHELPKIREATSNIIETANPTPQKDMTDFIMLDHLYQTAAENKNIGTYILFTGDGHFQHVTRYLTQKKKKEVIIYGVNNAFSSQLKESATKYFEYPYPTELAPKYYDMIIKNFDYISDKNINPTFLNTVEAVADYNHIPQDRVRAALHEMLNKGYVYHRRTPMDFNHKISIICANWELLIKDGLWNPDA